MRKAVMILLALAALRLLPRALRSEARALQLTALLYQATTTAIVNTSKTTATEQRVATVEASYMPKSGGTFTGHVTTPALNCSALGCTGAATIDGQLVAGDGTSSGVILRGDVTVAGDLLSAGANMTNFAFLASLRQQNYPYGTLPGAPASYNQGYFNGITNAINALAAVVQGSHLAT